MDGTTLAEGWNSSPLLIDSQFLPITLDAPGPFPFPEFPAAFAVDLEPTVERILFAVVLEDPAHGVKHPQDRPGRSQRCCRIDTSIESSPRFLLFSNDKPDIINKNMK